MANTAATSRAPTPVWEIVCPTCGGAFVYFEGEPPTLAETLDIAHYRHVTGAPVRRGEPMCCDSCGADLIWVETLHSSLWRRVRPVPAPPRAGAFQPTGDQTATTTAPSPPPVGDGLPAAATAPQPEQE